LISGYLRASVRHRFADCVLDAEARELRRGGRAVPLSPKAFRLLELLLEARPRALRQRELRDALWPDTQVGYTSLARLVTEARKAIGDGGRGPRLIRTVPRYGYAFADPAAGEVPAPPSEVRGALVTKDGEYPLGEGENLVGRGAECGVRLPSGQVSRVHARVRVEGRATTLEDLGSKNGTWINDRKAEGAVRLEDGDVVIFGTFRVVFRCARPEDATRTGRPE
jgi:DNA-binding winged helix-turn-helix (wHTH) protein